MSNHNAPCDIPKPASVDEFLVKNGKKKKVPRPSIHAFRAGHLPSRRLAACVRGNVADEVCLLPQSFMSGLFRKKGRGADKKLLSRRDIVFGECVRAGGSPVGLLTHGFTLFSADLEGKSGDRMDLLEASPAVRKSFSGNASRQADQ
jgi:hypothetical protein